MTSRTRWLVLGVSTPLVIFVVVGGLLGAAAPRETQQQAPREILTLRDVMFLVMNGYVEPANMDAVMDGAMRGLTDNLDSESAFLSAAEVKAVEANAAAPAGDPGISITRQFYLRILGVREGSPAARAGLQTGDFIRAIDGTPTRDMSAFTGRRLLRGAPGSTVKLTIIRGNAADPHEFTLTRDAPAAGKELVAVKSAPGPDAHVRVSSFGAGAVESLKQTLLKLQTGGAKGAVLDLRGIADGAPQDGIAAARLFLKSGTLGIRAGRGADKTTFTAEAGDGAITMPIVVLVSNGTANAAEVLTAALAGNDRAEVVGEPTAGLAAEQKLVKLPEGRGLLLTYRHFLLVDGTNPIHGTGVRPTVGVEIPSPGFDELAPAQDVPLAKAFERLRKRG